MDLVNKTNCTAEERKYIMIRIERTVMDSNHEWYINSTLIYQYMSFILFRLRTVMDEDFTLRNKMIITKLALLDFEINPRLLQGSPWANAQDGMSASTPFVHYFFNLLLYRIAQDIKVFSPLRQDKVLIWVCDHSC